MGSGVPERTRTFDLQVRNLTLYPLSYGHPNDRVRIAVAEREGFEPSEEETPFNGLANRRTRPLCDLSQTGADDSMGPLERPAETPAGRSAHAPHSTSFEPPVQRLPVIGQSSTQTAFEAV